MVTSRLPRPPWRVTLLLLLPLATASPGRRLMEQRPAPRSSLAHAAKPLRPVSSPPPAESSASIASTNRSALLLRRSYLLQQVAEIDAKLREERDTRRAALTAEFEQKLAALDDEQSQIAPLPAGAGDSLREQIAAAIVTHRERGGMEDGHAPHQDVAHQDVDIDVVLTHIDADGDGVITKAEAKSASAGATVVQFGPSAAVGCLAGVLCYLACRLYAASHYREKRNAARMQHSCRCAAAVAAAAGSGTKTGGEAVVPPPQHARMRKHKGSDGPAVVC
jgi:hypothetical protein